jgi:hypothetical protein
LKIFDNKISFWGIKSLAGGANAHLLQTYSSALKLPRKQRGKNMLTVAFTRKIWKLNFKNLIYMQESGEL